ncbi:hypothetical protein NUM3379_30150 [Kineococcus sp. NUM-3379]
MTTPSPTTPSPTTTSPTTTSPTTTSPAPARLRRTRSPLARTAALARFEAAVLLRQRTTLLTLLLGPAVAVGLALAQRGAGPQVWTQLLGTAMLMLLALTVHYPALTVAVGRRESRVFARLRTSELTGAGVLAGVLAPLVVAGLLGAALVCLLYGVLGGVAPTGVLPVLGVVLATAGLLAAALAVATATPSTEAANWTALPLVLVASVAGQVLLAPGAGEGLRTVALLLPFASLADLLARTSSAPLDLPATALPLPPEVADVLLLAAWTLLFAAVARRRWRWGPRD